MKVSLHFYPVERKPLDIVILLYGLVTISQATVAEEANAQYSLKNLEAFLYLCVLVLCQ